MIITIVVWIICGIIGAGGLFADFQKNNDWLSEYMYAADLFFCIWMSMIGGPFMLIMALCTTGFFKSGWRLWRKK